MIEGACVVRWRECDRRRLRTRKGGWRTRDPHHRQCDVVGIVPAWICRGCEIPDLDRKAALWDACGGLLVEAVKTDEARCAHKPCATCGEGDSGDCDVSAALAAHADAMKEAG